MLSSVASRGEECVSYFQDLPFTFRDGNAGFLYTCFSFCDLKVPKQIMVGII